MILTLGIVLVVASAVLGGVAVLIPRTPSVPLDRRQPFRTEPDSQLTRFAGSAVQAIERFLGRRNFRYFNRETLENAGLRLSQADFLLLVLIGAFVGALVGLVVAGPLLAILLVIAAPFVGHLVLGFLAGKRRT
jgi:tight adherence protein B